MSRITLAPTNEGLACESSPAAPGWLQNPLAYGDRSECVSFLSQLVEEGFAKELDSKVLLPWDECFQLLESDSYGESVSLLNLPPVEDWRPVLSSRGTLADVNFSIVLSGWIDPERRLYPRNVQIIGALLVAGSRTSLMRREVWKTVEAIGSFHRRPSGVRCGESNRLAWAEIRRHAIAANAELSDFLKKTIVLTPERFKLTLRKGQGPGAGVVEVMPGFDSEPPRWLEIFDRFAPQDHYQIPDGEGLVHVMVSPEVRSVLSEIKRMPGRRVVGERAEAFVRNPFAVLGPGASGVIDPEEFERARDDAGISFARFVAEILPDEYGVPYEVAIVVQETLRGVTTSERIVFSGTEDLEGFIAKLDDRISRGAQCLPWKGYELEILGDTADQLESLKSALGAWRRQSQIKASEILDLSRYSERVEGFGQEKPYYSPFIAKTDNDSGWFPDNVVFGLSYTPEGAGEPVALALDTSSLGMFRDALAKAKAQNQESFNFPGCPRPVKVLEAEDLLKVFSLARKEVAQGTFEEKPAKEAAPPRQGLVVKPNIEELNYEEQRKQLATLPALEPQQLPSALKPGTELKAHQLEGLVWLRQLWANSPRRCRGGLLADDMGLGKTLQILTFMAGVLEQDPTSEPFLVVAPVTLLENWKDEIGKFFKPDSLRVLTLYGAALASVRSRREDLDEELIQAGVTRLLKRGWRGEAKIVLTTYETLRDLEFSLAGEKWSAIVCDEAQKIKSPNALVTRAAKKQNARFRIACTGTPVENSLADLWCLFDFIQPGLLGALSAFGRRYRKPIEAKTDEERQRVDELRQLIEPQTKRRLKTEVARDLPAKILSEKCRRLPMSARQRALYAEAIASFRQATTGGASMGLKNHLGLLLHLKRICSDPRPVGAAGRDHSALDELVKHSPKLSWLVEVLQHIRENGEKVLIFCEVRELQRILQRVVAERLGVLPDIINGDTTTDVHNSESRHRRIGAFQREPGFGVIILSPLAVGFGMNIQAANHVVHFTRTWNPAKEDQATDRAYRIGQTRDVHVYCPVVVAEDFLTFDAKLDTLLEWKRSLSMDMLNGTGELEAGDFADLQTVGGERAFGSTAVPVIPGGSSKSPSAMEILEPCLRPILQRVIAEKLPMPVVGHEIEDGSGRIVAAAELAWPERKVAIVLSDDDVSFSELMSRGWRTYRSDDVATQLDRILAEIGGH